ncbi:MAG: HD domain-containing protein [Holophagaceae bacterium]|nr:HD domain-containing protein [Holophagaceae bacterium]
MGRRLDLDSQQFKQKFIKTLIDNTPVCYVLLDKSFKFLYANQQYLRLRKLEGESVVGEICYNAINGGEQCSTCAVREAIQSGQPKELLRKDTLPDGSVTYISDLAIPIIDENSGDLECVLEILTDRTKEILIKEQTDILFLEIVDGLLTILEKKDAYTCNHCRDVSAISSKLTWYLGLGPRAAFNAILGGLLHDLGKLHVPDNVLLKNGKLDDPEFAKMKEHPMFTYLLLPDTDTFKSIRDIAIAHHERWDGKGYPNALKGTDIPLEARIAAIADTYNAMTSTRPYRKELSHEIAMEEIKKNSGTQFDPELVDIFVQMVEDFGLDKDALSSSDESLALSQNFLANSFVQRTIVYANEHKNALQVTADNGYLHNFEKAHSFLNAIFDNTPAFYMIVDDELNVLYASENYSYVLGKSIEEIMAGKCYEATNKKMCSIQRESGCVGCDVFGAIRSEKVHHTTLEETYSGQTFFFDAYAIPIELEDVDGNPLKCCLEILFDQTKEKRVQYNFERDLKQIISILYNLVSELELNDSGHVMEISEEASSFKEYLDMIHRQLASSMSDN